MHEGDYIQWSLLSNDGDTYLKLTVVRDQATLDFLRQPNNVKKIVKGVAILPKECGVPKLTAIPRNEDKGYVSNQSFQPNTFKPPIS